mgnify:CR=1 FL=1
MNYKTIYDRLMVRGKTRLIEGYSELHHIVPKCIDGTDDPSNLVRLTPEEHLIAHLLLVKIYPTKHKLVYAANMMKSRVANNKEYGWVKRKFAEVERLMKTGIPRTPESVEQQKATIARQYSEGRIGSRKGSQLTDMHKQRISEANKGKVVPTKSRSSLDGYILRYGENEGTERYITDCAKKDSKSLDAFIRRYGTEEGACRYNSWVSFLTNRIGSASPRYGKAHTEDTKQKISASKTGKKIQRTAEHNAKIAATRKGKPQPTDVCPHCGLVASITNIKRWHGDKCKHAPAHE